MRNDLLMPVYCGHIDRGIRLLERRRLCAELQVSNYGFYHNHSIKFTIP